MKIGGNNYANNNCDYAVAFDFVVGRDAVSKTFGNLAIEKDDGAAGDQNNKSNNHPCYTERPVDFHKGIIAYQSWLFYAENSLTISLNGSIRSSGWS